MVFSGFLSFPLEALLDLFRLLNPDSPHLPQPNGLDKLQGVRSALLVGGYAGRVGDRVRDRAGRGR